MEGFQRTRQHCIFVPGGHGELVYRVDEGRGVCGMIDWGET